jgi:nucleoside-diphosphate-sugar epimerase
MQVARASAKPRALVIGGTGPTGPFVVEGLHERGYAVTILHGGQHEVEFAVGGVRHIHEDPHFREGLERGVGEETFDLVVAQYGRLRIVADVFAGRTERLIAVGGATALYAPDGDERWGSSGRPALFSDTSDVYVRDAGPDGAHKLGLRMVEAMESVFEHHAAGHYSATYIGYPLNYGPRTPGPYDWSIIRRVLDGRRRFAVADGALKLDSRIYTANAAAAVLLAVDEPDRAAGRRYSVADENAFTMRQRIEMIARHLGHELELVDMPYELAWPCHPFWRHVRGHRLTQSGAIRAELGYRDPVGPDEAVATTVDWLLANPPQAGGELERQIADPFDYEREDELMERWDGARGSLGDLDTTLPVQGHQYRHPKIAGEAWKAPAQEPRG